jgi:hypothetical protein
MTLFDRLIPVAFLACVGLTACGDRINHDGYPTDKPAGRVDTVMQPDLMPAPAPEVADTGERAKDSASTKPLASLDAKKESTGMPEALHGNNHSSPAVEGSLKKSSLLAPKTPKIIWI